MKEQFFYDLCKRKIQYYINRGKIFDALKVLRFCAQDKYYLNDILCDDDLEHFLCEIACLINTVIYEPEKRDKKVVVFYDQVSLYGRVLSRVYLEGLNSIKDIKLIYISYKHRAENDYLYKYCENNGIEYYDIGKRYSYVSLLKLINLFKDIKPDIVLSQNHADDFVGVIANLCLEKKARRYLINITDHAFWIGKTAYDKIIEFRDFGAYVSTSLRNIPETSLIKLPYYAADLNVPFQGFPFDAKNKRVVLSGGSLYKVQGSDLFFDVIKHILDNYDDTVFYFLGNGCKDYVFEKLNDKRYLNRVFVDNERMDLDEVIKRSYIYVNTYPLIGGLMTLYSMKNGVVPFTLVATDSPANDIRDFVVSDKYIFYYEDMDSLIKAIDSVMRDTQKHQNLCRFVKKYGVNKSLFNISLGNLISKEKTDFLINIRDMDYSKQRKMYLASFNDNIPIALFSCGSFFLAYRQPVMYIKGFIKLVNRKIKVMKR